jgi:hypothetical protein
MRAVAIAAVLAAGLFAGEAGPSRTSADRAAAPEWSEVAWPFLLDAWPNGRAFRCQGGDCSGLAVYVRPKIGFCNCATGVDSDDEIDRVGDLYLLGDDYKALAPGRPVEVGLLEGRTRPYLIPGRYRGDRHALGVAVAHRCDVLVATVVSERPLSVPLQDAALAMLATPPVLGWAAAKFGGS